VVAVERIIAAIPSNRYFINWRAVTMNIAAAFLVANIALQPFYKYAEQVLGVPRINMSFIMLLLLMMFLAVLVLRYDEWNFTSLPLIFFALLYVVLLQVFSMPWVINVGHEGFITYFKVISRSLIGYSMWFAVGAYLFEILDNRKWLVVLLMLWASMAVLSLSMAFSNVTVFAIILSGPLIYLMLADSFALLSIMVALNVENRILRHAIFLLGILVLFTLLSRTALYFFIFVYLLYLFKENRRFFMLLLGAGFFMLLAYSSDLQNERMFRIILGGDDASARMRFGFMQAGWQAIKQEWFLGTFMGDIIEYEGETGRYIHSYLAFWRQFGLIPFLVFVITVVIYYSKTFVVWWTSRLERNWDFIFYIMTFLLLEIIWARTFHHAYIWMCFIPVYTLWMRAKEADPDRIHS